MPGLISLLCRELCHQRHRGHISVGPKSRKCGQTLGQRVIKDLRKIWVRILINEIGGLTRADNLTRESGARKPDQMDSLTTG